MENTVKLVQIAQTSLVTHTRIVQNVWSIQSFVLKLLAAPMEPYTESVTVTMRHVSVLVLFLEQINAEPKSEILILIDNFDKCVKFF